MSLILTAWWHHTHVEVRYLTGMGTILSSFQVTTLPRAATGALHADAVDGAFATIYGEANLTHFEVWAYHVNPLEVSVGDPIDLSKRLDGCQIVRLS